MNRILFRFIKISQINIKRDLKIIYATLIDPGLDNWHKKSFLFFLPYKKFLKKYLEEKMSKILLLISVVELVKFTLNINIIYFYSIIHFLV